eukprot:gene24621-10242_t
MSSLAAARADGFYYPPRFFEEEKIHLAAHATVSIAASVSTSVFDRFNGQHPLRERANKLDQGILVIRFEVPFHINCEKCKEMVAKGERFNAEKKAIGNYLSTKIWQFSMTHHCGCKIVIQTDPKNAEYLVVEGARKKDETYSSKDIGVIEFEAPEEKAKIAADPFYKLEFGEKAKEKAKKGALSLLELLDYNDIKHQDPYALNKSLRAQLRKVKYDAAELEAERKELNLHPEVGLLPSTDDDANQAALAFFADDQAGRHGERATSRIRGNIMAQSIFGTCSGSGSKSSNKGSLPLSGECPFSVPSTGGRVEPLGHSGASLLLSNRADHTNRADNSNRTDNGHRADNSQVAYRSNRVDHTNRADNSDRTDNGHRAENSQMDNRSNGADTRHKADYSRRSVTDHYSWTDNGHRPDHSNRASTSHEAGAGHRAENSHHNDSSSAADHGPSVPDAQSKAQGSLQVIAGLPAAGRSKIGHLIPKNVSKSIARGVAKPGPARGPSKPGPLRQGGTSHPVEVGGKRAIPRGLIGAKNKSGGLGVMEKAELLAKRQKLGGIQLQLSKPH